MLHQKINPSHTSPPEHYSTVHSLQTELMAGQVVVMGPDDLMVSVARWCGYCLQSDINARTTRICVVCACRAQWHSRILSLVCLISQFLEQAIRKQNPNSVRCSSQQPHPGFLLAKQNQRATLNQRGALQSEISPRLQRVVLSMAHCSQLVLQKNRVQSGKRPLSSLIPTIVVPTWHKCGIYTALSSSGGQQSLSVITQVWSLYIINVWSLIQ